nr:hypothetical protein [Tanacetum cinerariifolium]
MTSGYKLPKIKTVKHKDLISAVNDKGNEGSSCKKKRTVIASSLSPITIRSLVLGFNWSFSIVLVVGSTAGSRGLVAFCSFDVVGVVDSVVIVAIIYDYGDERQGWNGAVDRSWLQLPKS